MLTIGLPVFNGERFLPAAIEGLLAQTHDDFELIIADNSSTDRTQEIAQDFVQRDRRVSYVRRPANLGAPANFNALAADARTPLFKWAAADDLHGPTYIERCLDILASDESLIGAYTRTARINERSEIIATEAYDLQTDSPDAHLRLRATSAKPHSCFAVFGVYRTDVLQGTGLIREQSGGDRILLAELALRGRSIEHPAYLLFRRIHEGSFSSGSRVGHNDPIRFWTRPDGATFPEPQTESLDDAYRDLVRRSGLPRSAQRRCERELWLRAARKLVARRVIRPVRGRVRRHWA